MNVYERIFNIVNLLKEVETGISINKISEILGMPTEIIREDIKNIYKDTKFEISIFPYDDTWTLMILWMNYLWENLMMLICVPMILMMNIVH